MPGQMSTPLSMNDSPAGGDEGLLSLGQAALDSGAVHPDEVAQAQQYLLGKKKAGVLPGPMMSQMLPTTNAPTGKGKQSKSSVKQDSNEKQSTNRTIWSTPDEFNQRLDMISQSAPILEQKKGIADAEKLLSMQEQDAGKDAWVKPLLALADAQNGSHMAAAFTAPEARQAKVMQAADNLQKRKEALNKLIFDAAGKAKEGTETNSLQNSLQQMLGYTSGMISGQGLADYRGKKLIADSGASFDKDQILKEMTRTNNNLDRAVSMINGKTPITSKNFAILQQDMINAMAPGGAATEGKVNREMVSTLSTMLNDLQLKGGSIQDLRKDDPALFKQLSGLIKQVQHDYALSGAARAREIHSSWQDVPDEGVQSTINRKLKSWEDRAAKMEEAPAGGKTAGNGKYPSGAPTASWTPAQVDAYLADHGG